MRPPPAAVRAVQRRHDCAGLPRLRLGLTASLLDSIKISDSIFLHRPGDLETLTLEA